MRKISKEELDKILEKHEQWLSSRGELGERADFYRMDFSYTSLINKNLSHASLICCSFRGADLQSTVLKNIWAINVDFRDANLHDADLHGACLVAPSPEKAPDSPFLLGNILVTSVPPAGRGCIITAWREVREEEIELYRELYEELYG